MRRPGWTDRWTRSGLREQTKPLAHSSQHPQGPRVQQSLPATARAMASAPRGDADLAVRAMELRLEVLWDTQHSFAAISSRVTRTARLLSTTSSRGALPVWVNPGGSDESAGRPHRHCRLVRGGAPVHPFRRSIRLAVPVVVQLSSLKLSSEADCAVGGAFHFCSGPPLHTSTIIWVHGSVTGSSLSPSPIQRPYRSLKSHEFV
jgi:hypothetical protein